MNKRAHNFKDLTGKRFGRLIVKYYVGKNKHKQTLWLCECDCGSLKEVLAGRLQSGVTKSCGCIRKEGVHRIHNHISENGQDHFYKAWTSMKMRCKRDLAYVNKGITVASNWLYFINFKEDMYGSYLKHVEEFGSDNTTLERNDVNGNYCLENCCWTTKYLQSKNKGRYSNQKDCIAVAPDGKIYKFYNIRKFCRDYKLDNKSVHNCLGGSVKQYKGWTFSYS